MTVVSKLTSEDATKTYFSFNRIILPLLPLLFLGDAASDAAHVEAY